MVAVLHPWHMAGSQVCLLLCPRSVGTATMPSATSPPCHHPQGAAPGQRSTRLSRAGRASPALPWLPSSSTVPTHNHCGLVVSRSSCWGGGHCLQGKAGAGELPPCPCHPCMGAGAGAELGLWHCLCFPSPCARCPQCPCCGTTTARDTPGAGASPEHRDSRTAERGTALGDREHGWGAQAWQDLCPACVPSGCARPASPRAAAGMGTSRPAPVTALLGS